MRLTLTTGLVLTALFPHRITLAPGLRGILRCAGGQRRSGRRAPIIFGGPPQRRQQMTLKSADTLLDVLHFADSHTAVIVPELGIRVTYDSLRKQVLAMANVLAGCGIRRGDTVAIALPNGLPAIVSFLAAAIAGTAAPLNPAYPYEEFH